MGCLARIIFCSRTTSFSSILPGSIPLEQSQLDIGLNRVRPYLRTLHSRWTDSREDFEGHSQYAFHTRLFLRLRPSFVLCCSDYVIRGNRIIAKTALVNETVHFRFNLPVTRCS